MKAISAEAKERIWEAIRMKGAEPLTDKELESLHVMLRSESMIKALAAVYALAQAAPNGLLQADFSDEKHRHEASKLQGWVGGVVAAIDNLLDLIVEQEEEDNG